MTAYLYRAPAGIAGAVTRQDETNTESGLFGSTVPTAFGVPLKVDGNGKFIPFAGSETAADFYGVLERIAPSIAGDTAQTFASGTPNANATQGIVVRGYVNVVCTIGTPVRGGTVYVRTVAASGKAIGDFEATTDSGNNVALTNVVWASNGKDTANGNIAEIRIAR